MTTQTYTLFMLLKTTRRWLDLEPKVRFAFIKENVNPIL
ncbi:darcynin, partial [Acidithiobacillus ferrooxidans F221]|nr:darcynin [Acidithiobacillus ferrooxidans F221]